MVARGLRPAAVYDIFLDTAQDVVAVCAHPPTRKPTLRPRQFEASCGRIRAAVAVPTDDSIHLQLTTDYEGMG